MDKPRITEISSFEYPKGRIDKFEIEIKKDLHVYLIGLFEKLGFNKESLLFLDKEYEKQRGYFFVHSKRIKAHLFVEEDRLILALDNSEDKKELIKTIEKFFYIF